MLIELINFVVFWLNALPSESGISDEYSPRELILHRRIDYNKHCRLPFWAYVEAHDDPTITNDSRPRTPTPAIALGPTGNAQGTYKFLSLTTGKKIKQQEWTEYPAVPDSIIKKVQQLAARDNRYGNLSFANRHGDLFGWNDEVDKEYDQMLVERTNPHPDLPAELPGVLREEDLPNTTDPVVDEDEITGVAEHRALANANLLDDDDAEEPHMIPGNAKEIMGPGNADNDDDDGILVIGNVPPAATNADQIINIDDENSSVTSQEWNNINNNNQQIDEDDDEVQIDTKTNEDENEQQTTGVETTGVDDDDDEEFEYDVDPEDTRRRSSRSNKGKTAPKSYDKYLLFSHAKEENDCKPIPRDEWDEYAFGIALQQYSIKAGLKKFGEKGKAAVTKELKQLHDMVTFFPIDPATVTKEQRSKAIASLMFLKEKRNGDVKGRACADGRPQREEFTKQDATSPTIATESIFLTALIDDRRARR
jgi:hypothetical protein